MIELNGKYNTAKVFTDNIEETAIGQIIELCNQEAFKDSIIRVMPDCLTEDTEILTKNGFKLIKNLILKDEIANYNPLNKKFFFSNPKSIVNRPLKKDEKVFEYFNNQQNFSFKVSEKHRMAIKNNMGKEAKFIEQVKISDMIFNGEGLEENFYLTKFSDNEIRLICWIVGDGNIKITHNTKSDNYRIRFGFKKQRKIDRLLQLLNEEKIEYKVCSTEKQTEIYINTEYSKKYLDMISLDKIYPKDFMFFNKDQSKVFIDEIVMIDGDYEAYTKKRGYRISSINKHNIDMISAIISLNYGYNKINYKYPNLFYINIINQDSLNYSRSGIHNRVINRREFKYDGNLVCVECDTSYFIARQNGLVFVTGNCHAGAGCTIGTTMTILNKVVPNLVGVDIGCGMRVIMLKEKEVDFEKLDKVIRKYVPCGQNVRDGKHAKSKNINLDLLKCKAYINADRAVKSLGTLGGGNHFIELNKDDENNLYLVIHSGSRYLGKQVAEHYQGIAYEKLMKARNSKSDIIKKLKAEGRDTEIATELAKIPTTKINKDLAYVEGSDLDDYLHDMNLVQAYATLNREIMGFEILKHMGLTEVSSFTTIHNYIDIQNKILRKGAISAQKNEKVIIPINMRDGSIIAIGKGNPDWNCSAPHGAGRIYSRSKAKEKISLDEFEQSMKDVWSSSVSVATIDESPMVYKPIDEIMTNIKDTVDIVTVIKPLYNFKAN